MTDLPWRTVTAADPPPGVPVLGWWHPDDTTAPGYYLAARDADVTTCWRTTYGDIYIGCSPRGYLQLTADGPAPCSYALPPLRILFPVEGPGVVVRRGHGWPSLLNVRVKRWQRICGAWRTRAQRQRAQHAEWAAVFINFAEYLLRAAP